VPWRNWWDDALGFYARCLKLAIAKKSRHLQMVVTVERYNLRPVRSPREWTAYHAIRRDAIFAALLPGQPYNERDADEFAPGHFPHVLVYDGEIVGTVRIDLIGEKAAESASAAISSGKATAALCSDSPNRRPVLSVRPRL
jgi:hypothetical protein